MRKLALVLVLVTYVVPVRATVLTTGDVDPGGAAIQPDPWNVGGELKVGDFGIGTLNVESGGVVSNTAGFIGSQSGSTGVATVTGSGSQWQNTGWLSVGDFGDGTLNIEAGGVVSNTSEGWVGYSASSTGEVTVTGSGSQWNNTSWLYVGKGGDGTLNVEAGGVVSNAHGVIGSQSGSTGEATVTGSDSQWNNSDSLYIGGRSTAAGGSGTLNLNDNGLVTVSDTTKLWSTGTLTLDGGSLTTGSFDNSEAGTFNFHDGTLTVNGASGSFNPGVGFHRIDGNAAGDAPHLVIANTATATLEHGWASTGHFYVGSTTQGALTVESGGVVSNTLGILGRVAGSTGEATVTGTNSQWNNSGDLSVGGSGDGTLNIEDGGLVSVVSVDSACPQDGCYILIGNGLGSTGEVTVTGSGSQLTLDSFNRLRVGYNGTGTLNVEAGGVVTNHRGVIAFRQDITSVATVTGANSQWNNSGDLSVGHYGIGMLNIEAGGLVTTRYSYIGYAPGSSSEATVTGLGSQWNTWGVFVGRGGNGTLAITDGGVVSSDFYSDIGRDHDSSGEVTVNGTGSQWNGLRFDHRLNVGRGGAGTLNIEAGGVVTAAHAYIGHEAGSTGVATVTGANSQWNNSADLFVGHQGAGTLNIDAGGVVTTGADAYIGYEAGSTGVATVTGANSQWNNSADLLVGHQGAGTLNIADEAVVTVGGATSIGVAGSVNLTGGRFEFGQTTLAEFSTINATSGSLVGNVSHAGYTDVSTLRAQNAAVDLTAVILTNSGVLYGDASMGNALINTAQGEIEVVAGERLRFGGSGNTNAGEINNFGGMVRFAQDLTNENGGFIGGRDTFFRFGGGLTNNGEIGLSVGVHDILGAIDNTINGRIMVAGQSTATFYGDTTNDGDIFTGLGSQSVFLGDVTGSGNFPGAGIVEFAGAVSPGSSPGAVHFGGDVLLGSSAEVESELLGTTAGSEHDQLAIAGTVNLDGTLDLLPLAPYTDPATRGTADDFLLITAGARNGTFNTIQYDGSPLTADSATDGNGSFRSHAGGGLFRSVTYTAATVQLQNLLALAGDTDGDRDVDLGDYNRLATNFAPGANGFAWTDGDFDSDGDIDLGDYNSLASNFAPGGYGPAAVPEPAAALLALLGMLVTCLSGNRSTHHTTAKVTIRANGR